MSEGNGLPKGWVACTLGEVLRIIRGVSYKKEQASSTARASYIPLLRATNIGTALDFENLVYVPPSCVDREQMLMQGDIVVASSSGSKSVVGKASRLLSEWHGSFGAFCMGLRVVPQMDSALVCYFMQTHEYRHQISELASGSNINNLRRDHIESFSFRFPPLPEQHRIVEKIEELFSDLDAGVSALERAKANLKRYRASVLKSAVEGRLTEDWRKEHPQTEDGQMLLDRILRERREKWEKDQLAQFNKKGKEPPKSWQSKYEEPSAPDMSELPELPEGWVWASLEAVAWFQNGHAFPSKDYTDDGVRLLRPGNLFDDGTVKWTDKNTRCLPEKWETECPGHIIGGHEVVMNLTAQSLKDDFLGRACLTVEGEKCLLNQRLARITPISAVAPRYLLFLLKSRLFREFVKGLNTGSLIQHMFTSQLKGFVFPLPPLAEQEQIVALVEERLSQIDSAEKTIDAELIRSKRLRQSILKRAFEGKLIPQDPKDEPASVLLERIKASKEHGQPKKTKKVKVK